MFIFLRRGKSILQFGLIALVVIFIGSSIFVFGSASLRGDVGDNAVARVNGEPIPVERYQRRYQELANAYAQVMRDRFSPELAERMGLPQQAIEDLVQEAVVVQRARREGLEVTDEELNAQIHAIPALQENGRFSMKRYDEIVRRLHLSKAAFEADVRSRLTRMKVEGLVRGGVKLSEGEIEQAYVHGREEARAAWALIDLAPIIAATAVTDAELETYLKDHAAEFRLPDRRRVQYVTFDPKAYIKPVLESEVERYYTEHAAEFESPRQVHAAHILIRVPETGGSEGEDKARAQAADIIRRVKAGEDFAKLAKELSQDPGSASRGGDLGFIRKGEVVPQFEQAAFALRKGEITPEPVRTPFGYHVIRVDDIREGGRKPLKEVAPQIRERLLTEASDRAARAHADEARSELQAAADFAAAAKKRGLTPVESTIARRPPAGAMATPDALEEAAFALAPGGVSAPVKTPAGYVVMKSIAESPAAVPPLADIKDKVAAALKRQKADAVALDRAKALATAAKAGDFAAAVRAAGASTGETARFSRGKPAEKLPGDVMVAALQTPAGGVTDPVKTPQGYYVVKVLERVPPDMSGLAAERDRISREVLGRKQSQAWETWVAAARANAKVDISGRVGGRRGA